MNELCILQDDVPPFPNEVKCLVFLGNLLSNIFFLLSFTHRLVKLSGEGLL